MVRKKKEKEEKKKEKEKGVATLRDLAHRTEELVPLSQALLRMK